MTDPDPFLPFHQQALGMSMDAYPAWGMMQLKAQIRFDRGLWGMGAGVSRGKAFINSLHFHRLPPSMMADYGEDLREVDPLAQATTAAAGVAVRLSMSDAQWQAPRYAGLLAYTQRYGMTHVLCVARYEVKTATHQFITLARGAADEPFTQDDTIRFEALAAHAMQGYATTRLLLASQARPSRPAGQEPGVGVVDAQGVVHDANPHLEALLRREWPQWQGAKLPEMLQPGSQVRWQGSELVIDFLPVHDCWLMQVRAVHASDCLSEREHVVARLYADGANHKEIAQSLGVSPATVRAHVRAVYAKLGVERKSQLAALLR